MGQGSILEVSERRRGGKVGGGPSFCLEVLTSNLVQGEDEFLEDIEW